MSTLSQDAAALRELKLTASRLKSEADAAKAEHDLAEARLFERMEEGDGTGKPIGSTSVGNTNFVRAQTNYGQIQDREAFVTWAEENAPELVEPRERKGLVNALVNEYLDSGQELPPGLGFYVKQYISQRVA